MRSPFKRDQCKRSSLPVHTVDKLVTKKKKKKKRFSIESSGRASDVNEYTCEFQQWTRVLHKIRMHPMR